MFLNWLQKIHYRNLKWLGEGSQGQVFRAERVDPSSGLKQIVALKVLHSRTAVELWRQEFESLSKLRSSHCVRVLSFERIRRRPTLVLEYIEGLSLAQVGAGTWLQPIDIQEIAAQLESALCDLHAQHIFHGDLSPQNVLVDLTGCVRVLDFGTANGSRLTPQFAAPERLSGMPVSEASDIFSLGKVCQFLGGTPDFVQPYLNQEPDQRRLLGVKSRAELRAALAERVIALRTQLERRSCLETVTHALKFQTSRKSKSAGASLVLSLMLTIFPIASHSLKAPQYGYLTIRTHRWLSIRLDGRDIGYAPMVLALEPGVRHKMEWTTALGHGEKYFLMNAVQKQLLEDSDFSH